MYCSSHRVTPAMPRGALLLARRAARVPLLPCPSQVIVIQIGLMNRLTDNVGGKLGWLLGWLGQAMPATHVAALAPYPSVQRTSAVLWQQMRPYVRARWPRVMPSMCGSNLNPANRTVYEQDGIHLTAEGKPGGNRQQRVAGLPEAALWRPELPSSSYLAACNAERAGGNSPSPFPMQGTAPCSRASSPWWQRWPSCHARSAACPCLRL